MKLIYFVNLGQIQNFRGGGSILVLLKAVPCRGGRGHPPPENFEIFDFRRFEAKSWCFEVLFF